MFTENAQQAQATGADAARSREPRIVHAPRVDVHESPDAFLVVVDLPGVTEQGLDVTVEKSTLTVSGKVDLHAPAGYRRLYGHEAPTEYRRAFTLSEAVDRDRIEASLRHGTLRLTLPKARAAQPRRIAVQAAA